MKLSNIVFVARSLFLILIFLSDHVLADSVYTEDRVIHGYIKKIDEKTIGLRKGCSGTDEQRIPWAEVSEIIFNNKCKPADRLSTAGGGGCSSKPIQRFEIFFRNQESPVLADAIHLNEDGTFHYEDQVKLKQGHGPIKSVRGILRRFICPDDAVNLDAPPTFCIEDKKFAVNFSYDTPVANKILTKGFSFFLETIPHTPDRHEELREVIRHGFGTAVGAWLSELQSIKLQQSSEALNAFLDGLVSKSPSGYSLFTPPQVVALGCPHTATFIIRVYLENSGPFAKKIKNIKAAFAAKPGRTILLNFANYGCWKNSYFQFVIQEETRCVNIVPVLIHELGHAFGLAHVNEADSIMNDTIFATKPSVGDLKIMSSKLMQSIQGEKAGIINFVTDSGVAIE
ncbi:MAG: matrixin family metalloprotease [Magnetococcales bacterium]|nr:matrixin family metalloprotease [Magnetococcales bacterium]